MSEIELGGANPSLEAVQLLADALGVEVFRLVLTNGEFIFASPTIEVPFARDGSYSVPRRDA